MERLRAFITFLALSFICNPALAGTVELHTVYGTNSQVTSTNLNGNNNVFKNELNGNLDNENADTANGFRFIEVKGSLPTAGTQGRVVYNTGDDTLNTDNGSEYKTFSPFETGMVMMWSGTIANIPSSWSLCNGSGGTPDLRDKFIVGAKQDDGGVAKTNITGSLTQSGGDTSHTHGAASGNYTLQIADIPGHTHNVAIGASAGAGATDGGTQRVKSNTATAAAESTGGGGAHSHTISSDDHVPSYYALAFICKD